MIFLIYHKKIRIFVQIFTILIVKRHHSALIAEIIAMAAALAVAVLWAYDPAHSDWMPRCWWHTFTGLQCPACGTMRALHACLHGDIAAAWRFNYMLPVYLPLAAGVIVLLARRPRSRLIAPLAAALAVLLLAWMIARNILGI